MRHELPVIDYIDSLVNFELIAGQISELSVRLHRLTLLSPPRKMSNLQELSQKIGSSLKAILDGVVGQRLAKTNKDRLLEARDLANNLSSLLAAINDEVISLEQAEPDTSDTARNHWEKLAPGILRGNSPEFAALRKNSEMLTQLFRSGIDIGQITKLSPAQLNISRRIGDQFGEFHRIWDRFKMSISSGKTEVETKVEFVDEALLFFKILQDTHVIHGYEIEVFTFRDRTWAKLPIQKIRHLKNRHNPLLFRFEFDTGYYPLITGHWFNGYVYDALNDQLRRLEVEYELYPLVTYTSRASTALSKGEFDILARIGDQRLVIECKSGRLRSPNRNDFPSLIERERALSEILIRTRLAKGLFILVYNPFLTDTAEVDQELASTDIETIPINDMRGRVIDLVTQL